MTSLRPVYTRHLVVRIAANPRAENQVSLSQTGAKGAAVKRWEDLPSEIASEIRQDLERLKLLPPALR